MGNHLEFVGGFGIYPSLAPAHRVYLERFYGTQRMQRHEFLTKLRPDPVRLAVALDVGDEGGYYVAGDTSSDVIDPGRPPRGQPSSWCTWVPNDAGTRLDWGRGDHFYEYVEWLDYLIRHFMQAWHYRVEGKVAWRGSNDDEGVISVANDRISVHVQDHHDLRLTRTDFLRFTRIPSNTKTDVFDVSPVRGGRSLGQVRWYVPWRRYAFHDLHGNVYESAHLLQLHEFLDRQSDNYAATKDGPRKQVKHGDEEG